MRKIIPELVAFLLVLVVLPNYAGADSNNGWPVYRGAWFTIKYPPEFEVRPSMKGRTSLEGYDSAFFVAPAGEAEFYVFSPQWSGDPTDIALNPMTEEYSSEKVEHKGSKKIRWVTISAKDRSYLRSLVDTETELNTRLVFGIKYRNEEIYDKFKDIYLEFVNSLRQYSD